MPIHRKQGDPRCDAGTDQAATGCVYIPSPQPFRQTVRAEFARGFNQVERSTPEGKNKPAWTRHCYRLRDCGNVNCWPLNCALHAASKRAEFVLKSIVKPDLMRGVNHRRRGISGQVLLSRMQLLSFKSLRDCRSRGLSMKLPKIIEHIHQVRLPFNQLGRKTDKTPQLALDGLLPAALESWRIC